VIAWLNGLPERAAAQHRTQGRPLATLTYAQSLDGSITARPGTRLAISGPETKLLTHQLRSMHDAILVGIGTVLADDPKLTARLTGGPHPQPVILDSNARLPLHAQLLQHPTHKPWIITRNSAPREAVEGLRKAGARVIPLGTDSNGRIRLDDLLVFLGAEGLRSVMVEGGAAMITSFLAARLVDVLILTIAPILVGGVRGVNDLGPGEDFPRQAEMHVEKRGNDLVVWGDIVR
jgi:riboflavin-specific deaminase-like protein